MTTEEAKYKLRRSAGIKAPLTSEQIDAIEVLIEEDECEYSQGDPFWNETSTWIRVDEEYDEVSAKWGYYEDDCKSSAPTPMCCRSIEFDNITFVGKRDESGWDIESDSFLLPENESETKRLFSILGEMIEEYDGGLESDVYDDYTNEEIIEQIEGDLSCSTYVKLGDGRIIGVKDDVESTLRSLYEGENGDSDSDEEVNLVEYFDCEELSAHELAEQLAYELEFIY